MVSLSCSVHNLRFIGSCWNWHALVWVENKISFPHNYICSQAGAKPVPDYELLREEGSALFDINLHNWFSDWLTCGNWMEQTRATARAISLVFSTFHNWPNTNRWESGVTLCLSVSRLSNCTGMHLLSQLLFGPFNKV